MDGMNRILNGLWTVTTGFADGLVTAVEGTAKGTFNAAGSILQGTVEAAGGALSHGFEAVGKLAQGDVDGAFTEVGSAPGSVISGGWNAVSGTAQGVVEVVGGTASGAGKALGATFHGGTDIVAGKVQALMEIRRAVSDIGAGVGARIGQSIDSMTGDPQQSYTKTLSTLGRLAALDVSNHHGNGDAPALSGPHASEPIGRL